MVKVTAFHQAITWNLTKIGSNCKVFFQENEFRNAVCLFCLGLNVIIYIEINIHVYSLVGMDNSCVIMNRISSKKYNIAVYKMIKKISILVIEKSILNFIISVELLHLFLWYRMNTPWHGNAFRIMISMCACVCVCVPWCSDHWSSVVSLISNRNFDVFLCCEREQAIEKQCWFLRFETPQRPS